LVLCGVAAGLVLKPNDDTADHKEAIAYVKSAFKVHALENSRLLRTPPPADLPVSVPGNNTRCFNIGGALSALYHSCIFAYWHVWFKSGATQSEVIVELQGKLEAFDTPQMDTFRNELATKVRLTAPPGVLIYTDRQPAGIAEPWAEAAFGCLRRQRQAGQREVSSSQRG
jgi:hypothetical protein